MGIKARLEDLERFCALDLGMDEEQIFKAGYKAALLDVCDILFERNRHTEIKLVAALARK